MLRGLLPNEGTLGGGALSHSASCPWLLLTPYSSGHRAKGQGGAAREAWSPVPDSGVGDVQTC